MKPLAIDLFCGLGGWTDGLLAEGYDVVGFDIEQHVYGEHRYPAQLVVQDVLTLHGSQFRCANLIVASPPCQEFSWMAMPWSRAKQVAAALRGQAEFPEGYGGSRSLADLTLLFDACFRIQREASAAAGRHIPMVVENVKGAQPWFGRARWSFGSFYLWGDVPALMPIQRYHQRLKVKAGEQWNVNRPNYTGTRGWDETKNAGGSWFAVSHNNVPHSRGDGVKQHGSGHAWFDKALDERRKNPGVKCGGGWFGPNNPSLQRRTGSGSTKRKFASAMIAKIPFELSRWIAASWKPAREAA